MRFLILGALLALTATLAHGSAFSIMELGTRASAMGTAFIGVADDASALYYNPAGIAFQPGTALQMDNLVVVGLFRFFPSSSPPGTVVPDKGFSGAIKPHFIPVGSLFMTRQLSEKWTFGFGVFAPFGLSDNFTNFNDGDPANTKYPGRFAGTRGRLEEMWFQPTIARRLGKNASIAVGPAFVHTHLFLEQSFLNPYGDAVDFGRETAEQIFPGMPVEKAARAIARLLPEGRSRVAGTAHSPGLSAGFLYRHPRLKTNFGLMWRSAVVSHLKGKASFAFTGDGTLQSFLPKDLLPKAFPTQEVTGTFVTPATYGVGIATSRFLNSVFAFDFRLQDYARFKSVPLNFSKTQATDPDVRTPAEKRLNFDFRNSYHFAFGMERRLNSRTIVRAGYLYDRSPVVDKSVGPVFPDANRHAFTVGTTRVMGNKEFSIFYNATKFRHRTTDVPENDNLFTNGQYKNFAHLAGVSLRLLLGGKRD